MEPGADLRDDFHRHEAGGARGMFRWHTVSDPVEKRAGEHIARAGEILGFTRKCPNVRLDTFMSNKGPMRTIGHNCGGDELFELAEGFFGRARAGDRARLWL